MKTCELVVMTNHNNPGLSQRLVFTAILSILVGSPEVADVKFTKHAVHCYLIGIRDLCFSKIIYCWFSMKTWDLNIAISDRLRIDLQYPVRSSASRPGGLRLPAVILIWAALILIPMWRTAVAEVLQVLIEDNAVNHVHPSGSRFTVKLKIDQNGPGLTRYYWRDFRGQLVTDPMPLRSGVLTAITAPAGTSGYLGLVLAPATEDLAMPNRLPGETREYGFALLPPPATAGRQVDPSSSFGMVHADFEDPYLGGWVKTMTWKTTSPKWWSFEMEKRRSLGLLELPIVVGAEWKSSDEQPISTAQLEQLKSRIRKYFAAHPQTQYWETGIEENLRHRYETPYYWSNLKAKIHVIREVADEVNPGIKLIYQIAELGLDDVREFLNSAAAPYFDILSLHPYAWPDFPDPATWLDTYIHDINRILEDTNQEMPLWFTEVGVPQRGNHPDEFFGYPGKGVEIPGKTPYEAVIYLVKLHIMAFHQGVEKIFWYNYRDRKPEREYAENHFGLRDYWGYPKPVYPAYVNLQKQLHAKRAGRSWELPGNIRAYEFVGQQERVIVAWAYPPVTREIPISALMTESTTANVIAVVDPVGAPVPYTETSLRITAEPIFIRLEPASTSITKTGQATQ